MIEEEQKRGDFRCWYRNPSRGTEALALYHIHNGVKKLFYPDFLIDRRVEGGDYIVDILEPHDPGRDDNVSKAKALAQYATENPCIGRAQLMRVAGGVLRRLDFASHSELREKVAVINTNEELEHLFARYGE